jgi:hypothetical protein
MPRQRNGYLEEGAMIFPRRGFLQLAAGTVALAAFAPLASAQTYPSRPITLVVPFPAAGAADVLARILAERMRETLGQSVVIENVTGSHTGALVSDFGVKRTSCPLWQKRRIFSAVNCRLIAAITSGQRAGSETIFLSRAQARSDRFKSMVATPNTRRELIGMTSARPTQETRHRAGPTERTGHTS